MEGEPDSSSSFQTVCRHRLTSATACLYGDLMKGKELNRNKNKTGGAMLLHKEEVKEG